MPSLVVLQSAHNENFDFLVDEACSLLRVLRNALWVARLATAFAEDEVQSLL